MAIARDPEQAPKLGPIQAVLLLVGLVVAGLVLYLLRTVAGPLALAFLLAYAFDPAVDKLESWRIPRALGAVLMVLLVSASIAGFFVFVVPVFAAEIRAAGEDVPAKVEVLRGKADTWLFANFKQHVPHSLAEIARSVSGSQTSTAVGAASSALFGTLSYVGVALSSLIVPVFAVYLLVDFDRIVRRIGELVPRRYFPGVAETARAIHTTLGGWVRGQLTANFVLAALYATGLRVLDIRLAVPIGILTGMLAFIPYIGFGIGLTLAVAMAVLDFTSVGTVVGVVCVMVGAQILDGLFITPRIVGRSVGLTALEVLIALMAAGTLFGFFGVLLAVPLGAVVKILLTRASRAYLSSSYYAAAPSIGLERDSELPAEPTTLSAAPSTDPETPTQ
jgi:predicted PurR-regulated permease PerM